MKKKKKTVPQRRQKYDINWWSTVLWAEVGLSQGHWELAECEQKVTVAEAMAPDPS